MVLVQSSGIAVAGLSHDVEVQVLALGGDVSGVACSVNGAAATYLTGDADADNILDEGETWTFGVTLTAPSQAGTAR